MGRNYSITVDIDFRAKDGFDADALAASIEEMLVMALSASDDVEDVTVDAFATEDGE